MAKKILVVDDEEDLVLLLRKRLEANQYEVVTAHDGQEGLLKVKTEQPDLIVSDIKMPTMDGLTFVKQLVHERKGRQVPIVILTAHTGMRDMFAQEGVTDYLTKPFQPEELLAVIEKHLA